MVYYGSRRNRRYSKRRNSRLSTRRIYSRTSAKSQASQIAALRNRINRVYRATKPECKMYISEPVTTTYTNSVLSQSTYNIINFGVQEGVTDLTRVGDKINVVGGSFYMNVEYQITQNNVAEEPSFHLGEASAATFRIIVLRPKMPLTSVQVQSLCKLENILAYGESSGDGYTLRTVSPLARNITHNFKVCYDKRYVIGVNNPIRDIRIPFPRGTVKFVSDDTADSDAPIFILVSSGLHADSNFSDRIVTVYGTKLCYTDA